MERCAGGGGDCCSISALSSLGTYMPFVMRDTGGIVVKEGRHSAF